MPTDKIQTLVLEVLREVQELSGRPWQAFPADATPIGVLDGFDSLAGIEATVMIEEKIGCEIDVDTVFVSEDGKHALTLTQVCERISGLIATVKDET